MAAGNGLAQRAALAGEVLLADELIERPRPHSGGQRLAFRRRRKSASGRAPPARAAGVRRVATKAQQDALLPHLRGRHDHLDRGDNREPVLLYRVSPMRTRGH